MSAMSEEQEQPRPDARRVPVVGWAASQLDGLLADRYVPLLYTAKGKRPGQRYLLHHVLLEDVALLVLAFSWTMDHPVRGAVGLALLHLSFWLVYEVGYHENDHLATKRESSPNIPSGSVEYGDRMRPRMAWVAALLVAAPGVALVAGSNHGSLSLLGSLDPGPGAVAAAFLLWAAYLLASRGMFWIYNRSTVSSRGLLYVGLQLFRTLGYVVVLSTNLIGVMALTALALARWVPYLTYREVGIH